jgi:signal transduction histidine kinase/ActR/RegA family two-component response regulator
MGAAVRIAWNVLRDVPANLRLRTKLILSFVILTAGLTCITLLLVRRDAQAQAQKQMEQDVRNAGSMFQAVQRQQHAALSREADLLASLAHMREGDATSIDEASENPWQSEDCNLFVLADKTGQIVALHSTDPALPAATAQEMLAGSVSRGETSGWWFDGKNLYQVVLQPFFGDDSEVKTPAGYVAVGRLIDDRIANDLGKIASIDVVFSYGGQVAVSTLPPLKERDIASHINDQSTSNRVDLDGDRYFASSVELTPGRRPAAKLIVLKSYDEVAAYLGRLNHLLLGIGLVAIYAGGALIFIIADTVTRPLGSLLQGVQSLEQGDFTYPLETGGHSELSMLTRAFDGMRGTLQRDQALREQLEVQLRQAHKMEALGRLAGGVAHDFNNLLTVIKGHSELLLDHSPRGHALHNSSQQIRKTADRAVSLTRQLLAFSRMQVIQPKVLDVNELIAEMGKLLQRLVREDIEFKIRLGDSIGRIKSDPGQLEQVLLNLTVNAVDAMPRGGTLTIETTNLVVDRDYAQTRPSIEPGTYAVVTVTDTGHGMDAETKARIFDPFFTTKEPGKGTGLGLATVYGVVKQSGGFIWVVSEPGSGTCFEVYLPETNEQPEQKPCEMVTKTRAAAGSRRETVLVVEDEPAVRELACEFLTTAGYSVLTAQDGMEALETAQRMGAAIQVVLTDVVMPRMRGPELGLRLKSLLPDVKVVYMTGYFEQNDEGAGFLENAVFLQKPFSREAVVREISQALHREHTEALQSALLS